MRSAVENGVTSTQRFAAGSLRYMGVKMTNKRNSWIWHHVFQWSLVWMTNRWLGTPKDRMYWEESRLDENGKPYLEKIYPYLSWNRVRL